MLLGLDVVRGVVADVTASQDRTLRHLLHEDVFGSEHVCSPASPGHSEGQCSSAIFAFISSALLVSLCVGPIVALQLVRRAEAITTGMPEWTDEFPSVWPSPEFVGGLLVGPILKVGVTVTVPL